MTSHSEQWKPKGVEHDDKVLKERMVTQSFQSKKIFKTAGEIKTSLNKRNLRESSLVHIVESLSHVQLFATPWTAPCQASLSITNSWSLLKLMSIESVMPSNHLILCHPLLLPPSIFPSIRVFFNESVLHIRWPKYWSSKSISSSALNFHYSPTLTSIHDYWKNHSFD